VDAIQAAKDKLDALHKMKISISDAILVLNIDDYIGLSTASEIKYARKLHKTIYWFQRPTTQNHSAASDLKFLYGDHLVTDILPILKR